MKRLGIIGAAALGMQFGASAPPLVVNLSRVDDFEPAPTPQPKKPPLRFGIAKPRIEYVHDEPKMTKRQRRRLAGKKREWRIINGR